MGTTILTCILLVLFFGTMILTGVYCRRHATNVDGFVLGGRSVGPWLTAFAFGTSYFSAVIFVGYAGQFGWNFGLASTWIGLGNAFIGSLLAWVILGRRTRLMTQHIQSKTMPDFFEKRYGSNALKIVASVIVFIFLIPYTASLYNGLSSLFDIAFDIPYWVVITVMALLTCVYVLFGGYMATAINDFIQGIIMLVGIIAVIATLISSQGGLSEAVSKLSGIASPYPESAEAQGAFTSFFGAQPFYLLIVVLLTSLGTWGLPQMVGKFYSIKNEDAIKKGTVISTLFAIVVAGGCYFIGGFGRLYTDLLVGEGGNPDSFKNFDAIVPTILSTLPDIIIAIVIILVLAASMSTLSSLVLTSASTLTLDVIMPIMKKRKTESELSESDSQKRQLIILRAFVAFFVAISALIAIVKDMNPEFTFIAQMMGVSWGALAGAFIAPFLYGLYSKRITRAACWVSFGFGVGVELIQLVLMFAGTKFSLIFGECGFTAVLDFIFKNSLYSGVFAMLGGLVLVPIVSLFTPACDKNSVDKIFACYDSEVTVSVTDTLGK